MLRRFSIVVVCLFCLVFPLKSAEIEREIGLVSYNVENLFYPEVDSLNPDTDYTPNGKRAWNWFRYRQKVAHIAQVLTVIGQWNGADFVGLCEVESRECVEDICRAMSRWQYRAVHFDSPDRRGIDVALLYQPRWRILAAQPLRVDLGEETTRDILFVQAVDTVPFGDTLSLFVCHLPSQWGGAAATAWKRERAFSVLQNALDSLFFVSPQAQVVVMGDMNAAPQDNLRGMHNLMLPLVGREPYGTEKYHGAWSYLDQFYVSDTLRFRSNPTVFSPDWLLEEDTKYLGNKPKRTYLGYRYRNGYSDHLPIVLRILRTPFGR